MRGQECGRRVRRRGYDRLYCWRRRRDHGSKKKMWLWDSRLGCGHCLRLRRRLCCCRMGLRSESRRRTGLPCGTRRWRPCRLVYGLHRWRCCWRLLGATLGCGLLRRWRTRRVLGGSVKLKRSKRRRDVLRADEAPAPHAGVRPPAMGSGVRAPDHSGTRPGVALPILFPKPPRPLSPRPRDPAKRV